MHQIPNIKKNHIKRKLLIFPQNEHKATYRKPSWNTLTLTSLATTWIAIATWAWKTVCNGATTCRSVARMPHSIRDCPGRPWRRLGHWCTGCYPPLPADVRVRIRAGLWPLSQLHAHDDDPLFWLFRTSVMMFWLFKRPPSVMLFFLAHFSPWVSQMQTLSYLEENKTENLCFVFGFLWKESRPPPPPSPLPTPPPKRQHVSHR